MAESDALKEILVAKQQREEMYQKELSTITMGKYNFYPFPCMEPFLLKEVLFCIWVAEL